LSESFDYQIGLADTAKWLRRTDGEFPRHTGYLKPDPYITDVLRTRYKAGSIKRPLVGISWRTATGAKVSTQKTISLDRWGSILAVPDTTFVSLQYGDCEEEIRAAQSAFGRRVHKDPSVNSTIDLDSLAAQIAAMDLVITTSNTTAHIAGALNVPTWVFVPKGFGGFWHWFLDRNDSPWYPAVKLFRQSERREWQPSLEEVAAKFSAFVETYRSAT
jgi:ADP-heptose:LPS heptosyltransferase